MALDWNSDDEKSKETRTTFYGFNSRKFDHDWIWSVCLRIWVDNDEAIMLFFPLQVYTQHIMLQMAEPIISRKLTQFLSTFESQCINDKNADHGSFKKYSAVNTISFQATLQTVSSLIG